MLGYNFGLILDTIEKAYNEIIFNLDFLSIKIFIKKIKNLI
jgi:hypothetical protein